MADVGYLGIDIGSISTNLVLIDSCEDVASDIYVRGSGSPILSLQEGLARIKKEVGSDYFVKGVGTTGSGRWLVGTMVGADLVQNEITAHARGAVHLHPDVQTVFEIGGQDSKVTIIRDGTVVDFSMNLVCAAGTGSFLDAQARRLNISIEEMSELSVLSENPTNIAGRCTVFAESDMVHKQQIGHDQKDIVMGVCHALVRNYLSNVCRGKELKPPYLLQGGVSSNKGIRRAFEEVLGHEVIVPAHHMVMGALGVALAVSEQGTKKSGFRGFDIATHSILTRTFCCEDCSNSCEVIEIIDSDRLLGRSGGRCQKWEGTSGPREEKSPSIAHTHLRPMPVKGESRA